MICCQWKVSKLSAKTNNSFLRNKIELRINHIPEKAVIKVLDCFAGRSEIWRRIKAITGKKIVYIPVEKTAYDFGAYFHENSLKTLENIDIHKFDVIDIDAYGVPFAHVNLILKKKFKGVVFVTFIQSVKGEMPADLLMAAGFSVNQIDICGAMLWKSGWNYFLEYLAMNGIKEVYHRSWSRKHYFMFNTSVNPA